MITARRRALLLPLLPVALMSCTSTRLKATWRDPEVTSMHFRKIVAFVVAKDDALRRAGEQELCKQVKAAICVEAFAVIPDDEVQDVAKVRDRVRSAGFDGAVVIRVVGRRVEETYVPPTPMPMWGFYGAAWPMAYDPGYVRQDDVVDVQSAIYSVAATSDRLLWVGTTESTNPRDVRRTVQEIADEVAAQLRKEGLIPVA